MLLGKWKMQMCRNQSTEMEVCKPGSEKKSWLTVFSTLLTQNCVLRPCSQRVTLTLRCKSWILEWRTAVSIAITINVTSSECGQIQTKTNGEWANHAGSMLLMFLWYWGRCECCDSFSLRIFANGSTTYKTTQEILVNSHCTLGLRRKQDYTHCVMLKRLC